MKIFSPILLVLLSACFFFEDEKKDEQNTNLTLSLHSAGVTTVNLNISPEDSLAEFTFELTRDDSTVQTLSIKSDTIIKDIGLNPNTSYTYKGYWINGTKRVSESDAMTVTTMDTTSHNFTWEIDTIGNYGSELHDAYIVNENDVWVVGGFVIPDSAEYLAGNQNYNMAHWNGNEWEYHKILGNNVHLYSITYFNENDIWVTTYSFPVHWDGEEWTLFHLQNMGISGGAGYASWGTSSSNMYFAGRDGRIVYYDGSTFTPVDNNDYNTDFRFITGTPNGDYVFVIGNPLHNPGEDIILYSHLDPLLWNIISFPHEIENDNINKQVYHADIYNKDIYFISDKGLWIYNYITEESEIISDINHITNLYRGTYVKAPNDYFFIESKLGYIHYNGMNFKYEDALRNNYNNNAHIHGGDYNGSMAIMVGYYGSYSFGIVARGYKN